jgi:D-3-phosphoglycerate dehydrogenase
VESASTRRARIVVFDPYQDSEWITQFSGVMAAPDIEFVVPRSPEQADIEILTADLLIATGRRQVTSEVIAVLEHTVAILCLSVGKDQVDAVAAKEAGIVVGNIPDYCSPEVADHAMALLLAAQRRLIPVVALTKQGEWNLYHTDDVKSLRRLGSQTLGIIGMGRIGLLVAQRAAAFGFTLIGYDPKAPPGGLVKMVDLRSLAQQSDAIVVCASLTPQSRHLLDDTFFRSVPRGLVLVNVARGAIIDEDALARALDAGVVAVAALDVRESEPPGKSVDTLSHRSNVIVTPHLGGTSVEAFDDLLELAARRSRDLLTQAGRLPIPEGARQ